MPDETPWIAAIWRLLKATPRPSPKDRRKRKVWSMNDLAAVSGVRANTLSDLINGKGSPRMRTLQAVARGLDVPLWALFVTQDQEALLRRESGGASDLRSVLQESIRAELAAMLRGRQE